NGVIHIVVRATGGLSLRVGISKVVGSRSGHRRRPRRAPCPNSCCTEPCRHLENCFHHFRPFSVQRSEGKSELAATKFDVAVVQRLNQLGAVPNRLAKNKVSSIG